MLCVSRRGDDMSVVLFKPRPLPDDLAKFLTADVKREEIEPLPWPVLAAAKFDWHRKRLQAQRARSLAAPLAFDWCGSQPRVISQPAHMGMSGAIPQIVRALPQVVFLDDFCAPAPDIWFNAVDSTIGNLKVQLWATGHQSFFTSLLDGIDILYSKRSKPFRDLARRLAESFVIRIARVLAAVRTRLLLQLDVDEPQITIVEMPAEPGAPHLNPSASKEVPVNDLN